MFYPNLRGVASCLYLSFQTALKEMYGHVAALLEATGQEGVEMVLRMEKARPEPPISSVTLRPLRRLYTPEARVSVLGFLPKGAVSIKVFNQAVERAELGMWVGWHWGLAPPTHIHEKRLPDVHLRNTLLRRDLLPDLKVSLGAWSWKEQSPTPRWEVLANAPLWCSVQHAALRRRLAAAGNEWLIADTDPKDVISIYPNQRAKLVPPSSGGARSGLILGVCHKTFPVFCTCGHWEQTGRFFGNCKLEFAISQFFFGNCKLQFAISKKLLTLVMEFLARVGLCGPYLTTNAGWDAMRWFDSDERETGEPQGNFFRH